MLSVNDLTVFAKMLQSYLMSGNLHNCEIFFGKYPFVFNKINTFALNSID